MNPAQDTHRSSEPTSLRDLFFSLPRQPIDVCSVAELGALFIHLFRDAATIYEQVLGKETIADSLITNHKKLWSFKQLNRPVEEAKGISIAVDMLHREFRSLSYRMTECLVPELTLRLGEGERSVNLNIERDSEGELKIVGNKVPGAAAIERLERAGLFTVELSDSDGQKLPLVIDNGAKVGKKGEPFLHVALALRDQAIAGFQQPIGVFKWMRDVIGLQDTVFTTSLRFRNVFLSALAQQYPGLPPAEVGFDVPLSERQKIAQSIREQAPLYRWGENVINIYSPGRESRSEGHTLSDVLRFVGVEDSPYQIASPQEAASLIFSLAVSIPVKMPKVFHQNRPGIEIPDAAASLLSEMKAFCYQLCALKENHEASKLIRENQVAIVELGLWFQQNKLPMSGLQKVQTVLEQYCSRH